jgi:DNA-binding transcriptional MerR regulator
MEELFDFQLISKLRLSIGGVEDITGINQRKLRYWEEKGIIHSLEGRCGANKLFDYVNVKKVLYIKEFTEEGFTLQSAVKKADEKLIPVVKVFEELRQNEK